MRGFVDFFKLKGTSERVQNRNSSLENLYLTHIFRFSLM